MCGWFAMATACAPRSHGRATRRRVGIPRGNEGGASRVAPAAPRARVRSDGEEVPVDERVRRAREDECGPRTSPPAGRAYVWAGRGKSSAKASHEIRVGPRLWTIRCTAISIDVCHHLAKSEMTPRASAAPAAGFDRECALMTRRCQFLWLVRRQRATPPFALARLHARVLTRGKFSRDVRALAVTRACVSGAQHVAVAVKGASTKPRRASRWRRRPRAVPRKGRRMCSRSVSSRSTITSPSRRPGWTRPCPLSSAAPPWTR